MGMQAGFAVIQTITSPELMAYGLGFIMIGTNTSLSVILLSNKFVAQLLSVSLALSISGAVFVNQALSGLQEVLIGRSRLELQSALTGLSGDFFSTLSTQERNLALSVIVKCLAKVFIPGYAAAALGTVAALFLSVRISANIFRSSKLT